MTYSLMIAPVLVALSAVFVALGATLVRNTYPPGARAAGFAMLAVAVWLFGAAGEILTVDSPALFPLVRGFKYMGVASVGPLFLVFVLHYAMGVRLSAAAVAALFALPATTVVLVWTNPLHELLWVEPFPPLGRGTWGPWFNWVHTPYSYLTILAGTGGLVLEMVRGSTLRRAQSSLLLVGVLVPLLVNALYLANPELPDLSQTPLSFGVTAAFFSWGFFRFRLFQVSPLALRAAFDAVGDGVVVVDRERRIADLNPAARALLDPYDEEEPLGRPVGPALAALGLDRLALEHGSEAQVHSPGGLELVGETRAIRDRRRDREVRGWIVVLRDVTERHRAETALRESEAMVRSILERTPLAILRLTPLRNHGARVRDFTVVLANPTAHEILVPGGDALVGRTLTDIRPPHTPLLMDMLRRALRSRDPEESVFQVDREGGEARWYRVTAVPVGTDVSITLVDISEERLAQEEMTTAAHTDPLTGLLNRRGLAKDGGQLMESARGEGRVIDVLYVDLDDFKAINDVHGHDAGDAALQEFARRAMACLRLEDVLARIGGDEFVILLQDPAAGTAAQVMDRIHDALRTPLLVEDAATGRVDSVPLACSIGVASMPRDGDDLPTLLAAADSAMYRSKITD